MDIAAEEIEIGPQPRSRSLSALVNRGIKRLMDIVLSALGILFLSPFFLLITAAIRRDSKGPIFYRGPRLGLHGRVFKILKFRTMYETSESYQGPRVTAEDDLRVTHLGRWLRQTKLNELPQLWNVLKGEMSLVGPRPEDPQLAMHWPEEAFQEVLSVRPGITSPASVLWRDEEHQLNGEPLMETYVGSILPSKLRLDQLYTRHRSIWLDMDIMFWTALVLLPRLGSYKPPEDALFAGPFSRILRRVFSWYLVDALITMVAITITGIIWRSFRPLNVGWTKSIFLALGFAFLFGLCGALFGTHRISWSKAQFGELFSLSGAAIMATMIALILNEVLGNLRTPPSPLYPPIMLVAAAALSFLGYSLVRFRGSLVDQLTQRGLAVRGRARLVQERVLIVGSGEAGQFAAWMLSNGRSAAVFNVIGFVDDDLFKQGMRIGGVSVLGRRLDIPSLVKTYDIGLLVFAIHNITEAERKAVLDICFATGVHTVLMPDILSLLYQAAGKPVNGNGQAKNGAQPLNGVYSGNGAIDPGSAGDPFSAYANAPTSERERELEVYLSQIEQLVRQGDLEGAQAAIDARCTQPSRKAGQV